MYIAFVIPNPSVFMVLLVEPEIGVPYSKDTPYVDLKARAEAACNTALLLEEHGMEITPTKEDTDTAAALAVSYAEDPEKTSKKVSVAKVASMTPASLVMTNNILQEFGHSVADNAKQIRHLVTNKLLLESENPDARVRMRALELLGKISDVGLFAEKSEITITHQSSADLRAKLRKKLEKIVSPSEDIEDAVIVNDVFDISEAFGEENEVEYDD